MYKNILVPMALDHGFGDKAVEVARTLLSEGGTITALHVYEGAQGTASAYIDPKVVSGALASIKERFEAKVAAMDGVKPVLREGHSGRDIVDYAAKSGADLIVMGSHKPGLADYFIGSTAARVVQHAPCAVQVLRTT